MCARTCVVAGSRMRPCRVTMLQWLHGNARNRAVAVAAGVAVVTAAWVLYARTAPVAPAAPVAGGHTPQQHGGKALVAAARPAEGGAGSKPPAVSNSEHGHRVCRYIAASRGSLPLIASSLLPEAATGALDSEAVDFVPVGADGTSAGRRPPPAAKIHVIVESVLASLANMVRALELLAAHAEVQQEHAPWLKAALAAAEGDRARVLRDARVFAGLLHSVEVAGDAATDATEALLSVVLSHTKPGMGSAAFTPAMRAIAATYKGLAGIMAPIVRTTMQTTHPKLVRIATATGLCPAGGDAERQRGAHGHASPGGGAAVNGGKVRTFPARDAAGVASPFPVIGLGVGCAALSEERYALRPGVSKEVVDRDVTRAITKALRLGYRMIDTSEVYDNAHLVGKASALVHAGGARCLRGTGPGVVLVRERERERKRSNGATGRETGGGTGRETGRERERERVVMCARGGGGGVRETLSLWAGAVNTVGLTMHPTLPCAVQAVKESGVPREELVLISKFNVDDDTTVEDILGKLNTALTELGESCAHACACEGAVPFSTLRGLTSTPAGAGFMHQSDVSDGSYRTCGVVGRVFTACSQRVHSVCM